MLEELRRSEQEGRQSGPDTGDRRRDIEEDNESKAANDAGDEKHGPFMSLMHQMLIDELTNDWGGELDSDARSFSGVQEDEKGDGEYVESQNYSKALSCMPRLIYYETTAETVNAVHVLVSAGEAHAGNCCALIDKQEGVHFLESLLRRKPSLMEKRAQEQRIREIEEEVKELTYLEVDALSKNDTHRQEKVKRKLQYLADELDQQHKVYKASVEPNSISQEKQSAGQSLDLLAESWKGDRLHIICSSVIYDDLFRQVRQWAREGNSASAIQRELDLKFQDVISQSIDVRDTVAEIAAEIVAEETELMRIAKIEKNKEKTNVLADGAAGAVVSSDGEGIDFEIQEFADTNTNSDAGSLEGASLKREESTVEKSAMATLAAQEKAQVLQNAKSEKKKRR